MSIIKFNAFFIFSGRKGIVKKEKMKKVLPASRNIKITDELLGRLYQMFGEKNVKAVEKYIENTGKMH